MYIHARRKHKTSRMREPVIIYEARSPVGLDVVLYTHRFHFCAVVQAKLRYESETGNLLLLFCTFDIIQRHFRHLCDICAPNCPMDNDGFCFLAPSRCLFIATSINQYSNVPL